MAPEATSPVTSMRRRPERNWVTAARWLITVPPMPISDRHGVPAGAGGGRTGGRTGGGGGAPPLPGPLANVPAPGPVRFERERLQAPSSMAAETATAASRQP